MDDLPDMARALDPLVAFPVRIAAIVPCHNEESAITKVVADLKAALPQVEVYVYDNDSTDRTAEVAEAAGAEVRCEPLRGKGTSSVARWPTSTPTST